MQLTTVNDTWFKARPALSGELSSVEKVWIPARTTFEVHSHQSIGNHVRVALKGMFLGVDNRNTWYAYKPDVEFVGNEPNNNPVDVAPQPAIAGRRITLPGNTIVGLSSAIVPGGHFTWNEATHGGTRLPASCEIVGNIIKVAQTLEEVRSRLGDRPIHVTSWYRPPRINRAVGGASRSRHIVGDAVDFRHSVLTPAQVYARLDGWWNRSGGLASARSFTHIDCRGYQARWTY